MKLCLLKIISVVKKVLSFFIRGLCLFFSKITEKLYQLLFFVEWKMPGENPLSFDHNIDLYFQWKKKGTIGWMERGIFSRYAINMFAEPVILELGCGDGFNSRYFYSNDKSKMVACDICEKTIKMVKRKYKRDNIEFIKADFAADMPCKEVALTNVIWDASINFFDVNQIESLLDQISTMLSANKGILSGVAVSGQSGDAKWEHYKHLFCDGKELEHILKKHFINVLVYGSEAQLYFYASNGKIPFVTD